MYDLSINELQLYSRHIKFIYSFIIKLIKIWNWKKKMKSYSPFNTMPTFTGGRDTEIKWIKRAIPKADTRCRKEVQGEVVTDRGAIGLI